MEKKIKTDEEETCSSSRSDSSPSPYLVATPSQISGVFFLGSWNRRKFEDAGRTGGRFWAGENGIEQKETTVERKNRL